MKPTKLLKTLTAIIAMLITTSAICSAQNKDFLNVIPEKTQIVIACDEKSLLNKSDFAGGDSMLAKILTGQIATQNPIVTDMLIKALTNPAEVGLDADEKVYFFMTDRTDNYAVVMKIADVEKVRSYVKMGVVAHVFNSYTEHLDYSSVELNNGTVLAFNDKTLICIEESSGDDNVYELISELLKNKIENSIVANTGFQKIMGNMHDVGMYISNRAIMSYYGLFLGLSATANMEMDPNWDQISLLYDVDFKNGMSVTKMELYSADPAVMNTFLKPNNALQKIKSTFFGAFPYSTLGYISMGFNGEEFHKLLIANSQVKEMFGDQLQYLEKIKAINGDISMAITGLSSNGDPLFLCYAEVKNNDLLKMLVNKKDGLISRSELKLYAKNIYSMRFGGSELFFGIDGKTMFVTNNRDVVQRIAKNVDNPLSGNEKAVNANGSYLYMMVNFDEILSLPVVQKLFSGGVTGSDAEFFRTLGLFSHAEIVSTSPTQMELNIYTKDKDKNSLQTLMEIVKKYFAIEMRENILDVEPIIIEEPEEVEIVDGLRSV